MKRVICLVIMFFYIFGVSVFAKKTIFDIPENIKVGIYYNSKALKSVTINGNGDLQLGYILNDEFNCLYELSKNEEITLVSDSSSKYDIIARLNGTQQFVYDSEKSALIIRHAEPLPLVEEELLQEDEEKIEEEILQEGEEIVEEEINDNLQEGFEEVQTIDDEELKLIGVQGKQYRGQIHIRRYSDSDMTIVSVVNIEDYLAAVVPAEIGPSSPKEAIKAQAIAAKNFVYNRIGKYSKWGFDVTNTTSDQVYEAYDSTRDISDIIKEVYGKVLMYDDLLAETYFFSTSGGYTADVKDVWGSNNYPYLVSVEDKYESKDAPKASWEVGVTPLQLSEALTQKGYNLGTIKDVEIVATDAVGRVKKIVITGSRDTLTLERESARIGLGLSGILSQWYTVTKEGQVSSVFLYSDDKALKFDFSKVKVINGDGNITKINSKLSSVIVESSNISKSYSLVESEDIIYRFNGRGWGHSVGLSQMGAIGMAKEGFTYDEILTWYYTGTEVIDVSEGIRD